MFRRQRTRLRPRQWWSKSFVQQGSQEFPTVQGTPASGFTAGGTDPHVITFPAGVQIGEGLLVFFSIDLDQRPFVASADSDAGWQKLLEGESGLAVATGAVFWHPATQTTTPVLKIDHAAAERGSWISYRIAGHNPATTPVIASSNGNGTNSDPPSIVLPSGDVLCFVSRHGDATTVPTVAPANYTNLLNQVGDGSGASTSAAYRTVAGGGTEDPGVFTVASEQWLAFTVAITNAAPSSTPAPRFLHQFRLRRQ